MKIIMNNNDNNYTLSLIIIFIALHFPIFLSFLYFSLCYNYPSSNLKTTLLSDFFSCMLNILLKFYQPTPIVVMKFASEYILSHFEIGVNKCPSCTLKKCFSGTLFYN